MQQVITGGVRLSEKTHSNTTDGTTERRNYGATERRSTWTNKNTLSRQVDGGSEKRLHFHSFEVLLWQDSWKTRRTSEG